MYPTENTERSDLECECGNWHSSGVTAVRDLNVWVRMPYRVTSSFVIRFHHHSIITRHSSSVKTMAFWSPSPADLWESDIIHGKWMTGAHDLPCKLCRTLVSPIN